MSSTITGLGSGFDINGWVASLVSVKQQSMLTPLEDKLNSLQTKSTALTTLKSKYSTLQSTLQTFTRAVYSSSNNMWTKTSTKSSNEAFATVKATGSVSGSRVDLKIEQIATATVAKSAQSLGTVSKDDVENTKFVDLANGQAKSGSFSMFLNGKEYSIDIKKDDTVSQVLGKINDVSEGKIQATLDENGNFTIKACREEIDENTGEKTYVDDTTAKLTLGSAGDGSNFASALKLHSTEGSYSYTSAYAVSAIDIKVAMVSEASGLDELKFYDKDGNPAESGKIIINGEEIEIDKKTTLEGLISKINGNAKTKVKATFDSLTNKIALTSTETGQSNISLTSDGTNLLNVLGLTTGEGENEVIATGSQELGKNAVVYINDNKVISNSNTITGESSGIANLSITVKKQTADYSNKEEDPTSVQIDIEPDHSAIMNSLQSFVNAYNEVVSQTETMTSTNGKIGRDASLSSILSQLKGITSTVSNNEGIYKMLSEIGIESDKNDLSKLTINSEKLEKALSENIESVKTLLSDGYTAKDDTGIFDQMVTKLKSVMDIEKGYFTTQADSVQSLINSTNTRIERVNTRLLNYQNRLTEQFNKMDTTISALNSQLSTFTSYMGG